MAGTLKVDKISVWGGYEDSNLTFLDFDGTLTTRDTFFSFLSLVRGRAFLWRHALFIFITLLLWKVGLYSAHQAKERIYALCLKGMTQVELERYGTAFSQRLLDPAQHLLRPGALELLRSCTGDAKRAAIVSASPELYVRPFCEALGLECLATRFEFDAYGRFTGHLLGANCNGAEKVCRIKEHYGNLAGYRVAVYGDSSGDYPMLELADSAHAHLNELRRGTLSFTLRELVRLMRVQQYVKNVFVFIPLFLGGKLLEPAAVGTTVMAALAFSLTSSFIYVINDLKDVAEDRLHSLKRFRPLAAGTITVTTALVLGFASLALGLFLAWSLNPICLVLIAGYLGLNLLYVYIIKQWALFDLVAIAVGFDLRVFTGAAAISVEISSWLILMVFLLAMFLAMGKRWDDLRRQEQAPIAPSAPTAPAPNTATDLAPEAHAAPAPNVSAVSASGQVTQPVLRRSLYGYSRDFALSTLTFLSAVNTICYVQYSMDSGSMARLGSSYLFLTSLWVVLGNLRYLQNIFVLGQGYSPTKILLKDRALLCCLVLWALHLTAIIYLKRIGLTLGGF